jgi:hypothetical protein
LRTYSITKGTVSTNAVPCGRCVHPLAFWQAGTNKPSDLTGFWKFIYVLTSDLESSFFFFLILPPGQYTIIHILYICHRSFRGKRRRTNYNADRIREHDQQDNDIDHGREDDDHHQTIENDEHQQDIENDNHQQDMETEESENEEENDDNKNDIDEPNTALCMYKCCSIILNSPFLTCPCVCMLCALRCVEYHVAITTSTDSVGTLDCNKVPFPTTQ